MIFSFIDELYSSSSEYSSEPETGGDNLTLDDQHEQYMNNKQMQKNPNKKSPRLWRKHKNRGKCRTLGN